MRPTLPQEIADLLRKHGHTEAAEKLERGIQSDAATCSPSSLTTERGAIWEKHERLSQALSADIIMFAGQMERERNELRCKVVTLTVALKDILAGSHGAMVRARAILSENTQGEAQPPAK